MKKKCLKMNKTLFVLICVLMIFACVDQRDYDIPRDNCSNEIVGNTTFFEVKNLYADEVIQIQEDLIIEGYVVSSDEAGNFFGSLYIQNTPVNPTQGIQIDIDLRDSFLFYPVGSKVFVKLKGLYLGKKKGVFVLGGVFPAFGNLSIGRLPSNKVEQHILNSCDAKVEISHTVIGLEEIEDKHVNTLVQFNNVEFTDENLGLAFAEPKEETFRTLSDCYLNTIEMNNSGYSDFQSEIIPMGNGSVKGVLRREKDKYFLVIRNLNDIEFNNERCQNSIEQVTTDKIFISEIADPDNNSGARFVELYNSGDVSIRLFGWTLNRYTNDDTEISSSFDLSTLVIDAKSTLVISANSMEFEAIYGFAPDIEAGLNSPADSNGDDNLQLIDPFGTTIDTFGIIGEDGSGTNHEFEDGRALRDLEIDKSNPIYNFSEWIIYNDNGAANTINMPQFAPQNFTPREHK